MRPEDEVVQDSEDEEILAPLTILARSTTMEGEMSREPARAAPIMLKPADISSALSGAAPATTNQAAKTPTATTSAPGPPRAAAPAAPGGRPRPRPAYKGALAKPAASNEASGSTVPGPNVSSDTSRDTTMQVHLMNGDPCSSSTIIDNTTHTTNPLLAKDASTYSLDIAERAKLRSRARDQKSNAKPPLPLIDDDVIDISSDDDINIYPAPKPTKAKKDAPSPRKRTKKSHTAFDPTIDDASPAIIPIATSNPSSQLPPSDPPPSTPPTSTPINALPMAKTIPSPLSSPIPPPPRPPKRKRRALPDIANDSDDDGRARQGALRKEGSGLAMPPPPPPFFPEPTPPGPASDTLVEGSSSTRTSEVADITKPSKGKGKLVIDDDDFEDEWPVEPPPKPKPKPRKKAADDDDGDWQGDAPSKPARKSRKDDEDEDEWAGDAPKKRKPRAPPKKKGKKGGAAKQVVEVVIEQRSPKGVANSRQRRVLAESPITVPPTVAEDELSPLTDPEADSRKELAQSAHTPPRLSPKPSPVVLRDDDSMLNSPRSKSKAKGKKRAIIDSDEEENDDRAAESPGSPPKKPRREPKKGRKSAPAALEQEKDDVDEVKEPKGSDKTEPRQRVSSYSAVTAPFKSPLPAPGTTPKLTMTNRSYTIGGGRSSLPMSELLKKVNSQPGSPFASPRPTYSPYAKTSKSLLRKIAPLHPNRRTPPPPPPRPPPPKKSKKQLELEEKWEMELEESVEGWYCMPEQERAALRRAKRDAEMGFED